MKYAKFGNKSNSKNYTRGIEVVWNTCFEYIIYNIEHDKLPAQDLFADKDIFLALVCGATTVMMGSALSGTDESPGRIIEDPATNIKKKIYRGMTSPEAVFGALYDSDNGSELQEALDTPPEGQEIQVPYKGSVLGVLKRIRGHLRSSISYAGETSLQAAREKILKEPEKYSIPLSESSRRESYER